jgi:hypothetical protein
MDTPGRLLAPGDSERHGARWLTPRFYHTTLCGMNDIRSRPERMPKSNIVMVRMDDTERALLECLAARWGVSLSAAIRRLIRESDGTSRRG